jgi:nuclear transport factor 2 (NTF2) superfamily protein
MTEKSRPPVPPFAEDTAVQRFVWPRMDGTHGDPERVSLAYTIDSTWRNRAEFISGRNEIIDFLKRKWAKELGYRLIKEMWAFHANRIAVRFAYEWHDDSGNWFRSHGNENWEFDQDGLMKHRIPASTIYQSKRETASIIGHWGDVPTIIRGCLTWICDSFFESG